MLTQQTESELMVDWWPTLSMCRCLVNISSKENLELYSLIEMTGFVLWLPAKLGWAQAIEVEYEG